MATIYGSKLSMALFASLIMFSFFPIHHKVSCQPGKSYYYHDQGLVPGQSYYYGSVKSNKPIDHDKEALIMFNKSVKSEDVNWEIARDVCSQWKGIQCDVTNSFVTWIMLPSMNLQGSIPDKTIGSLKYLTILSLHGNNLSGPIPSDFSTLENLIKFDLHSNQFTGELPKINVMKMDVKNFNVSNNNLSGAIPASLSGLDKSSFSLNSGLCGPPLKPCLGYDAMAPTPEPSTSPSPGGKKPETIPKSARIGIAVVSPFLALFFLSCFRKDIQLMPHAPIQKSSSKDNLNEGGCPEPGDGRNKFEDGMICSFGLEDLSWERAEDLGEGRIGSTYKAWMIKKNTFVVVKKLNDIVVTKNDFESLMEIFRKSNHQNVVPLRAYHCCEVHEKLLVYDYFPAGSVHDLLHGSRGSGKTPVDWNQRMQIALSAASGLAYLHSTEIVHGNFKSSNILLREVNIKEAVVSDYGLNMLSARSVTLKSDDVYGFGVFLLELLTRKDPNQDYCEKDLPGWVKSFAQEEWKTKVFDTELMGYQDVEEKMVKLMEIAMDCVSLVKPPPMDEVVNRIMEHMSPNTLVV